MDILDDMGVSKLSAKVFFDLTALTLLDENWMLTSLFFCRTALDEMN